MNQAEKQRASACRSIGTEAVAPDAQRLYAHHDTGRIQQRFEKIT
ncbi:hypothetical protein [Castellaniella sp. MT123]